MLLRVNMKSGDLDILMRCKDLRCGKPATRLSAQAGVSP